MKKLLKKIDQFIDSDHLSFFDKLNFELLVGIFAVITSIALLLISLKMCIC